MEVDYAALGRELPDYQLLAHLGIDEELLFNIVGRSRQSFWKGRRWRTPRGEKIRLLFRTEDIFTTREMQYAWGRQTCNEEAVINHLYTYHGAKTAEFIEREFAKMARQFDPTEFAEVWVLLPDAKMEQSSPKTRERRKHLPPILAAGARVTFWTSGPHQEKFLIGFLGTQLASRHEEVSFKWDSPVGCWPNMLIGNPHDEADLYLLGDQGFFRRPRDDGKRFVAELERRNNIGSLGRLLEGE